MKEELERKLHELREKNFGRIAYVRFEHKNGSGNTVEIILDKCFTTELQRHEIRERIIYDEYVKFSVSFPELQVCRLMSLALRLTDPLGGI